MPQLARNMHGSCGVPTLRFAIFICACCHVKVDASKVGQALYPLVMAEKDPGSKEGGLSIGAQALTAFRELYRYTWDEPRASTRERECQ